MGLRLGRVKVPVRYVEVGGLRESGQTIREGLAGGGSGEIGVWDVFFTMILGFVIHTEFMMILSQSIACYG